MVFYRKYRPQNINELDSTSVRETLHAVLQKNIPHAFLFTGPKGLGKTSTARIVAKVVNCETAKNKREKGIEPCNKCDQCVSITVGNNVDILEIDAASNRGIDEIRELKEKIRLSPVSAKRKVYIIDEVHMLTTEAFNALLKTLEEPPEHAMFILCTTEAHKVPETIVSRCFQIMFKPATEEELVRSFKRIVIGEKLKVDDEALGYIAQLADRGFRDGVKVLEEVSLLAQEKSISKELIDKEYKMQNIFFYREEIKKALEAKEVKESLEIIIKLTDLGIDLKNFLTQLMGDLHELLLVKLEINMKDKVDKNPDFTIEELKELFILFSKAYTDMKTAVLPQLPLELAIIEWCEISQNQVEPRGTVIARSATTMQSLQSVIPEKARISSNGSRIKSGMTNENEDGEVSVSTLRKQIGTIKKLKALYGEKKAEPQEEEIEIITTSVELMHANGDGTVTKEWMDLFWKNLIMEMKKYNHTVAGVLRGCSVKSYADQKLVIQTAYKFHKERLDDMKNRDTLLKIGKLLTGKDIAITVELKKSN
jgi:DNA polymerase III subunit gamma/tau